MDNLFDTGGLLSKKNLSAWFSVLFLCHLPFFIELYVLLSFWAKWWGLYLAALIAAMLLGATISGRLLQRQLDRARRSFDRDVLTRLLGCYLLPLPLLTPGLTSFLLGLVLTIPAVTLRVGSLLIRLLAIAPQQWYNSILLVHTQEEAPKLNKIALRRLQKLQQKAASLASKNLGAKPGAAQAAQKVSS